jgi:hypothetical protein
MKIFEIGVNYSWLHVNSADYDYQRSGNGGSGYIFGPRFNWRHTRLNPYIQFLFGGGYAWSGPDNTTQNAFAMASGGGLDYNLTKRIFDQADTARICDDSVR